MPTISLFIVLVFVLFLVIFSLICLKMVYKKVPQGQAIVRTGAGDTLVSFYSLVSLPILHQTERIDMSTKKMDVSFSGEKGLLFKEGVLADMDATFFLRINPDKESILAVAQSVGAQNTFDKKNIYNLFESKFKQTVRIVADDFNISHPKRTAEGRPS